MLLASDIGTYDNIENIACFAVLTAAVLEGKNMVKYSNGGGIGHELCVEE